MSSQLPIDEIRERFEAAVAQRPVVITAPTGTGKSTQIPRWLLGHRGVSPESPVLVIQPRRVAARAVAARIADQEQLVLGKEVGYRVRDDDLSSSVTRLLVATPGIVLARPELLHEAALVILDELHERRLDTDLIFALLAKSRAPFVAMSATMDGDAVAAAVNAVHLSVKTRTFPVAIEHIDSSADLPNDRGLGARVKMALERLPTKEGDVLVFLPGKGEIERVGEALRSGGHDVVPLHGGLSLKQQAQALNSSGERRVILSTNVAETSVTIPGVRAVIDSGLVRRTSYHNGRTYLSLSHVALDSADQRAGRAGRTAPGTCIRLWGQQGRLAERTPPEIHREELAPLVMVCARLRLAPEALPFLDPPKDYALADTRARLRQLGALETNDEHGCDVLTNTGKQLIGLPLDPWLSRILVEARRTGCLDDALDLVALLEQPAASRLVQEAPDEELQYPACDVEALLYMMREGKGQTQASKRALFEARSTARRLRRALGCPPDVPRGGLADRALLLTTLLRADPVCAHVARSRKRRIVFSNGGTELDVGRDSRVNRLLNSQSPDDKVDALVVLETHGILSGAAHRLLITVATPVPLKWLAQAQLGTVSVKQSKVAKSGPQRGQVVVTLERNYAGRTLEEKEVTPEGEHARTAIVQLFERGSLKPASRNEARRRLARRALAHSLSQKPKFEFFRGCAEPPALADWLKARLEELGVERGDDLQLLSDEDFLPDDVPAELAPQLDDQFPLEVDLGDSVYSVDYDLKKRQVTLSMIRGNRKTPPPPNYLPRFEGLKIFVEAGGSFHPIKR